MRFFRWIFLFSILGACSTKEINSPTPFEFEIPPHFPKEIFQPERNIASKEGIELGKMLFFDPILSGDGTISCGTCHRPEKKFSDGLALSNKGISARTLERHTPPLFNLLWHENFFWDGGAKDLESQNFGPLQHPDEMGADLKAIILKIQNQPKYKKYFLKAFGTDSVTSSLISRALAQYQRTLIAANSKYDRMVLGSESFSDEELKGLKLFENHCSSCHSPPLFTDLKYHNKGLDFHFPDENEGIFQGRFRISRDSSDMGAFKTPSLRNLAFTAPYGHDGRFADLDAFFRFMNDEIQANPWLSSQIPANGFGFSDAEIQSLKAFLNTLNENANY